MAVVSLFSCTKEAEMNINDIELKSFHAWMRNHHSELLENYQSEGGYYVEVLDAGTVDSAAYPVSIDVADEEIGGSWIAFNLTGRDLAGRVCITRDQQTAKMQGSYTRFTHYVPFMRFLGATNTSLLEGSYLAMKNEITLGESYVASYNAKHGDNPVGEVLQMHHGTKLRLYMPSSLTGGSGLTGDGGYEGEFSLDGNRPVIMDIEITGRVNNPVSYEAFMVDGFGISHGGLSPLKEVAEEEESDDDADGDEDEDEEEDDGLLWRHACDTIQGLIVSKRYSPKDAQWKFSYDYPFEVDPATDDDNNPIEGTGKMMTNKGYSDREIYADMSALEEQILAVMADEEAFPEGEFDGEKVGKDGTAKVWYITRFLDGFIIDSNIAEVRKIVFGADEASGSVLTYSPESDKDNYVTAWYYTIPHLRHGQWATIVTTSTFAYGASGRSGSTTTSSSGSSSYYYDPYYYNYYNYYNSYYGSSYYDMYYYNMYNNYYYNDYYSSSSSETTTTSTSTEIQPYTPLIFQIYIEAKE